MIETQESTTSATQDYGDDILNAIWRYAALSKEAGEKRAVKFAITDMIGASQFLVRSLGIERTRRVMTELLETL